MYICSRRDVITVECLDGKKKLYRVNENAMKLNFRISDSQYVLNKYSIRTQHLHDKCSLLLIFESFTVASVDR